MNDPQATVIAHVAGEAFTELPQDLYIPPDALEVFLETFEGPLDLLLYLIRRQNLNVLDIPVALITQQYLDYINVMEELRFDLAAEYLVMAAWLAEIKSRVLLPKPPSEEGDDAEDISEEFADEVAKELANMFSGQDYSQRGASGRSAAGYSKTVFFYLIL